MPPTLPHTHRAAYLLSDAGAMHAVLFQRPLRPQRSLARLRALHDELVDHVNRLRPPLSGAPRVLAPPVEGAEGIAPLRHAVAIAAEGREMRHARIGFALASAYAGHDIGPGRLAVAGALEDGSPRAFVRTLIAEGCVGETLAALEAAEAAEHAADSALRDALRSIAGDETRHAQLAWRTLGWALESGDAELERSVIEELPAALDRAFDAPFGSPAALDREIAIEDSSTRLGSVHGVDEERNGHARVLEQRSPS